MQVRSEKRYQGVLQTVSTVWQVIKSITIYLSISKLTNVVHQQRGFVGFFDGSTLRLSRKVLSSVIGWAVYEGMLIFIRTRNATQERQEAEASS